MYQRRNNVKIRWICNLDQLRVFDFVPTSGDEVVSTSSFRRCFDIMLFRRRVIDGVKTSDLVVDVIST